MPQIARFAGVTIHIFYGDHPPPHVHVRWAGGSAKVDLGGGVVEGALPIGRRRLIVRWIAKNKTYLAELWEKAANGEQIHEV